MTTIADITKYKIQFEFKAFILSCTPFISTVSIDNNALNTWIFCIHFDDYILIWSLLQWDIIYWQESERVSFFSTFATVNIFRHKEKFINIDSYQMMCVLLWTIFFLLPFYFDKRTPCVFGRKKTKSKILLHWYWLNTVTNQNPSKMKFLETARRMMWLIILQCFQVDANLFLEKHSFGRFARVLCTLIWFTWQYTYDKHVFDSLFIIWLTPFNTAICRINQMDATHDNAYCVILPSFIDACEFAIEFCAKLD